MDLKNILFVGGNVNRLASVKIRCADIAQQLGCDTHYRAAIADDVPGGYQAYVCVKPDMREPEVQKLSRRALVVWDILDHQPPVGEMTYLASTRLVAGMFQHLRSVTVIPHHHCNFEGIPNQPENQRPIWVGHSHWYPTLPDIDHERIFIDGMTRQQVVTAFRKGGIGLNFRAKTPAYKEHQMLNSGIKLINCMGFGMPSISADEPAYREHGETCTIFSTPDDCASWVAHLTSDKNLYRDTQARCIEESRRFHIDHIAGLYRAFLLSL